MPAVYLLITAHTTRHLRRTLLGVAAQSHPAAGIVLSCDNDSPELAASAAEIADELQLPILLVQRPFTGAAHCGQVRNNAVRALLRQPHPPPDTALLVCLDQDCIPAADFLAAHERLATKGDPILAFRVDLTAAQTDAIDESIVREGKPWILDSPQQFAIDRRHRRLARQAFLRRIGLVKGHKPKILGANFAVTLRSYLAVNGFDETYRGYGQEDDDFVRRLYANGCRPAVGVREAMVYHQFHPTRAPEAWHIGPNADRFKKGGPSRCIHGVDSPLEQEDITIKELGPRGAPVSPANSPKRESPPEQPPQRPLQPSARGGR